MPLKKHRPTQILQHLFMAIACTGARLAATAAEAPSNHLLFLTFPQAQGIDADQWNGFSIWNDLEMGPVRLALSVEYGEWVLEEKVGQQEVKGYGEGTIISVWAEKPFPLSNPDFSFQMAGGIGIHLTEIGDFQRPSGLPLSEQQEASGHEWVPQVQSSLRWIGNTKLTAEAGLRLGLHFPSWRIENEDGSVQAPSYQTITPFVGIGLRF